MTIWDKFKELLRDRKRDLDEVDWSKQAKDQGLHVLVSVVVVGVLVSVGMSDSAAMIVTLIGWGFWEARQRPSSRWWDPIFDWTVQVAATLLAGWFF